MISLSPVLTELTVDSENLAEEIKGVASVVLEALSEIGDRRGKRYILDAAEISLAVNASGKLGFMGLGAQMGAGSTIRLNFKRAATDSPDE